MQIADLTNNTSDELNDFLDGSPGNFSDSGGLSFAAVAAPEPSSVGLLLLGIGLVFVVRKRVSFAA
jgi:hypothetical protein